MDRQPIISVVICAHNEQDWIAKTLASLVAQKRLPDEIIVVDNASTDQTPQVVERFMRQHPARNIRLVHEAQKGLYHARDAGWRAATGEIIVTTDADITFPADWLEKIERRMSDPNTAAVTGVLRYTDALPLANWVTAMGDSQRAKAERTHLNGGNSAIRRHILAEVDGYVGKPLNDFEDQYLTRKLEAAGYSVRLAPEVVAWHTFRRFKKEGFWGYIRYIFFYSGEGIYPDHLSDESPYTVSVVLAAHNAERTITNCLTSLMVQQPRPHEVLVVDAGSTDGTAGCVQAFLAEHTDAPIRLLRSDDSGAAWETGWRAAQGDLIVQASAADTFPDHWLARIHAAFIVHPAAGAVRGEIRPRRAFTPAGLAQTFRNLQRRYQAQKSPLLTDEMTAYRREALATTNGAPTVESLSAAGYTIRFTQDIYTLRG